MWIILFYKNGSIVQPRFFSLTTKIRQKRRLCTHGSLQKETITKVITSTALVLNDTLMTSRVVLIPVIEHNLSENEMITKAITSTALEQIGTL